MPRAGILYGSPRVHAELQVPHVRCAAKRGVRLMRHAGMCARRPRCVNVTTASRHSLPVADNMLDRAFATSAPNRKWAADSTYVSTHEGWLYLAVVMDLFSRRIIGWSMQVTLVCEWVRDALRMALHQRDHGVPLIHIVTRQSLCQRGVPSGVNGSRYSMSYEPER